MRHPRLLALLVAALVLIGASPAASMTPRSVKKQPTLLWRTYPLKQRPATPHRPSPPTQLAGNGQALESRPGGEDQALPKTLAWGLLGAGIAAVALLLVLLRPVLSAATGSRPTVATRTGPDESARRPVRVRRRRRRPREHPAKPVPDASKPGPEDLLEALRPKPRPVPEPEVEKPPQPGRRERAESPPVPLGTLRQPEPQQKPEPGPTTRATAFPAPAQLEPEPKLHPEERGAKPEAAVERPQTSTAESCEIELWRGYVKCQLYAASLDRPRAAAAFAFSPFFRLRDEDTPTEKAAEALKTLVDRLERDGWTVVSAGARWYQLRLDRSL
jgi:hypothetical protein